MTVTAKGILETNLTNIDATETLHCLRQLRPRSKIVPEIKSHLGYSARWKVFSVQPKIQRLTVKKEMAINVKVKLLKVQQRCKVLLAKISKPGERTRRSYSIFMTYSLGRRLASGKIE